MSNLTLGNKIAELRRQKGISQEALAEAVGVSRQTVFNWEADVVQPSLYNIKSLVSFFEVNALYFFDDDFVAEEENVSVAKSKSKPIGLVVIAALLIVSLVCTVLLHYMTRTVNNGDLVVSNFNVERGFFYISLAATILFCVAEGILVTFFCLNRRNAK